MKIWTKDNSEEIVKMRRRMAFIGMMRASVILLIIMSSLLPGTFAQVGNLLLDEFLLLWIKASFSTSSYSQVGDYLSAGPCIQDASCESPLFICFVRHQGACLSSWFLTESFTNRCSMCTLSFNTPLQTLNYSTYTASPKFATKNLHLLNCPNNSYSWFIQAPASFLKNHPSKPVRDGCG